MAKTTFQKKPKFSIAEAPVTSIPRVETAGASINFRDSWRVFRVVTEMVEGFQFLSELKREVVVFGSARIPANDKYYKITENLGRLLGKNGFTTITGGGPGIMEAANKGAFEVGGESIGLNIQLPFEQRTNPFVKKSMAFYYFFTRKVMLTSPSNAYVFLPGGFGTLDEFFEVVDYMSSGNIGKAPIILVGAEYWEPVVAFLRARSMAEVHSIQLNSLDNWHIVETAEEAFAFIKDTKDRANVCDNDPNNPLCLEGTTDWRTFRILAELVEGFEFLTSIERDVTVLGTKSCLPGSVYYNAAYEVGKILAKNNRTVVTGGGPGIMEAANKGAFELGAPSVGVGMQRDGREHVNNYVTKTKAFFFPFIRKLMTTSPSELFVLFPGGFGTLHQLYELLTLQETKKMEQIPILLYGRDFWEPLLEFHHQLNVKFKTISPPDELLVRVVNDPSDIIPYLNK